MTSGNPWILDTTASITTKPLKIWTLRWVGGANTNLVSIVSTDTPTGIVWGAVATADNFTAQTTWHNIPYKVQGFNLAITGGKLYVYIDGPIPFSV